MPRAALNKCKYCGIKCRGITCSRRCKKLDWNREHRNEVKIFAQDAIKARKIKILKRWIDKIKNKIPRDYTKEQKIFIAKLVAKEVSLAYHKGVEQGKYISIRYK